MKKYLIADTETTGFIQGKRNEVYRFSDLSKYPRIIQLSFMLCDESGEILYAFSKYIRPDGWQVPEKDFWIENGHSTEKCEQLGVSIESAMVIFLRCVRMANAIVFHNKDFDYPILISEAKRKGLTSGTKPIPVFCTMSERDIIDFVGAKYSDGRSGKFPKLQELHNKLFGHDFEGAHDAKSDTMATMRCFFKLREIGFFGDGREFENSIEWKPEFKKEFDDLLLL